MGILAGPFSPRYHQEVADLTDWLSERLPALGPLLITDAQYRNGIDSLSDAHRALCQEAFMLWLSGRGYELSYNQGCNALFDAARRCQLLTIVN